MGQLSRLDFSIIAVYACALIALGLYLRRRASASLEDYFLGGRQLPWWALGISGSAAYLDVTGTMVIVSFLYLLGPRGLYVEFRGGAVLVLAFMMIWTGKWHRRSGCMTEAEWTIFRFGASAGGHAARIVRAVAEIVFTIGGLAYLLKGMGLFLSTFLPYSPTQCALGMVAVAGLYTMISGFYGVVISDIFQFALVVIGVVAVVIVALTALAGAGAPLGEIAERVTGNPDWTRGSPVATAHLPAGYENYRPLGVLMVFYLVQSMLAGLRSGADPKFFGARSERECGLIGFLWISLMTLRWPMMIAFAILGLLLVAETVPDQSRLAEASAAIRQQFPDVAATDWDDTVAQVMYAPEDHPELVQRLRKLLGDDTWRDRLKLAGFHGTVNPERVLPAVLLAKIPGGLRGILLMALLAASMSTFDSNVNKTLGFFTKDIYQAYLRPAAGNGELMTASYVFGGLMIAGGFALSFTAGSINAIWDWIVMGLGAGLAVPGVLRLYWWRFNAGGMILGTLGGMGAAVVQKFAWPELPPISQFVTVTAIALVCAVVATYLTPPTNRTTLETFYRKTQPFGLWKPLRAILVGDERIRVMREQRNDLAALPCALLWQITLFLIPMQILVADYPGLIWSLPIWLFSLAGLYRFWYRPLAELDSAPA
jgi:SSS family solute:Na+ symporter